MNTHDHLVRAIARETNLRIIAAVTTDLVIEGAHRHQLSPAASCAVGRALTSGLLLATMTKGGERVTVQLVGDGPIGSITVDATDGDVRGYALRPNAGPVNASGRLAVVETLGKRGVVNVVRDLGLRELYQGQVPLVTGEVDEDVEAYLRTSEQVPSALGCEVVLGPNGEIQAAGGILVQALPGGDTDAIREIQHTLRTGGLYDLLASGERSASILAERFYPHPIEIIGDERKVRFQCRCSAERISETLHLLTTIDLDEMIAEGKASEVTCNFCNTRYEISLRDLEKIREDKAPRESN
jgi:molecular chaperone Hsp33